MKSFRPFIYILVFAGFLLGNGTYPERMQILVAHSDHESTSDSDTKENLNKWFLACKEFYKEIGSDNTCTLSIAEEEEYGLAPQQGIVLHGWGLENDFCIVGWHQDTNVIYAMNSGGMLLEMGVLPVAGELSQGKPQKIWIYEEFPPMKMAFLLFGASLFGAGLLFMPARKPGFMKIFGVTLILFAVSSGIYYFSHSQYQEEYIQDSQNYSKTLEEYIQSDHADPKVFCQAFPNSS